MEPHMSHGNMLFMLHPSKTLKMTQDLDEVKINNKIHHHNIISTELSKYCILYSMFHLLVYITFIIHK